MSASTTLVNDTDLKFAIAASENWAFDIFLSATESGNGDIKIGFTVPAGATIRWGGAGASGDVACQGTGAYEANNLTATGAGTISFSANGSCMIRLSGTVVNSTTAGTVQLQWAQNSSSTSTTVQTNSNLVARKLTN